MAGANYSLLPSNPASGLSNSSAAAHGGSSFNDGYGTYGANDGLEGGHAGTSNAGIDTSEEKSMLSFRGACMVFFKSCFGAALLAVPFAFRQAGLILGIAGTIAIGAATTFGVLMLSRVQDLLREQGVKVDSFSSLGFEMGGILMQEFVNLMLVMTQFGTCVSYVIFISSSISGLVSPVDEPLKNYAIVLWIVTLVLLIITYKDDLKAVSMLLLLGFALMAFAIFTVIIFGLTNTTLCGDGEDQPHIWCHVKLARFDTLPSGLGVITFALEGVGTVLHIKNGMRDARGFENVVKTAVPALTATFVSFGALGYLLFGTNTVSVLTLNINGTLGDIVKIVMSLVPMSTYPLQLLPVIDVLQDQNNTVKFPTFVSREASRAVIVLLSALVAFVLPNFGFVVSVIGCVSYSMIGFVFPALWWITLQQREQQAYSARSRAACICCIIFGVVMMFTGLYANFAHTIHEKPVPKMKTSNIHAS